MKAIILNKAGSVDNLLFTDIPTPDFGDDEILVEVKTISINPVDVKSRAYEGIWSWLFAEERPVILGWDISGVISQKGKNVNSFEVGDEVFGMVNFPGNGKAYAQYVAAPASHLTLKPQNISHKESVAATLAALTAWQVLVTVGKVKKGDKVLIHAAAGGVGHFAVQIAKHLGLYVIGTSSAANREFVLSLGADEHIDYRSQNFEDVVKDVDFVFDTIAGDTMTRSLDVVKKGGQVITIPSGDIPKSDLDKAAKLGVHLSFLLVESNGEDMAIIADMLEKGILKSYIDKTFSFDEMRQAHLELEKGRTRGKIVIEL